jgi:hypothetical protein
MVYGSILVILVAGVVVWCGESGEGRAGGWRSCLRLSASRRAAAPPPAAAGRRLAAAACSSQSAVSSEIHSEWLRISLSTGVMIRIVTLLLPLLSSRAFTVAHLSVLTYLLYVAS